MPDNSSELSRRVFDRQSCAFSSELNFDGSSLPCQIVNISAGGAKLRLESPMGPLATAELNITPYGRFAVDIVWNSGTLIGIRFHASPDTMAEIIMAMATY